MAIIPRWRAYRETFYRESSRECLNWRTYEGGALIKVADSAIFTVVEPVHDKTNNLGFRPGPTQTSLYSHRRNPES